MLNFVQKNDTPIQLTTSVAVKAGEALVVGGMVCVPVVTNDSTDAKTISAMIFGVFRFDKQAAASGQAISQGAIVYWDATNKRVTTTSSGNTKMGFAAKGAATTDDEAEVALWQF